METSKVSNAGNLVKILTSTPQIVIYDNLDMEISDYQMYQSFSDDANLTYNSDEQEIGLIKWLVTSYLNVNGSQEMTDWINQANLDFVAQDNVSSLFLFG